MINKPIHFPLGQRRCVEPKQRMVAGRFGWAVHRFPIKGGLTLRDMWSREQAAAFAKPGYLWSKLAATKGLA